MVSVQERLKLKRAQIDTWSIREQLCLASSVLRSGDQNWMSVSRSLKAFGDAGRPADWFSQKSCAVQYSSLLENVETPKRKKRTDKGDTSVDTPSESIVRRLTQERIDELKRLLNEDRQLYAKLKEDVMLVKSGCADDKLSDMCQEIEEEKRQKERKAEAHERWLKEREEKKVELERAWKPPVAPASPHRRKHHPKIHRRNSSQSEPSSEAESALDSPLSEPLNVDVIGEENVQETSVEPKPSQTPTSPLLTSLLKSPSPAPTSSQGSSILHSAITSHRGASPTITSLLSSAPGVPGAGNLVTVAPPTAVSSSLKNLVSSAISSEQPHHQPPPHNPSPAAGAPTLSMLLELPPSLPGKPLPELPSAAKTTTLPPSTAIVSAAVSPCTTTPKVIALRGGTSIVASTSSPKIITSVPASSSTSIEVQATSQEIKVADSTSKDEDIEVLHVDSSQNSMDAQQMPIETKEELIEEVLIEEVVVNDDSVIESELLSSQISDVVVATEQEDTKDKQNKEANQIKLEEQIIEVSQSTDVSTQKEDTKAEMVADVDSTSNNMPLPVTVENTSNSEEKNAKEECSEAIIDTSSQELVSEIVTEEAAAVEVMPATEAELTSGAVAEVIEITEDEESTIQTEVVGECGPCMQELEDMEVIILDKVQGLDEVQIVEEMKELECEVVEVVMGTQEKVEDEVKEDTVELMHDDLKPEDVSTVDTSSLEDDSTVECKDTDVDSSSKCEEIIIERGVESDDKYEKGPEEAETVVVVEEEEEEEETIMEDSEGVVVIGDVTPDSEKSDDVASPDITIENDEEQNDDTEKQPEIIVERTPIGENSHESKESEDEQEQEELSEDVHNDIIVHTSVMPIDIETVGDLCDQEFDTEDVHTCEDENNESEKKDDFKKDAEEDEFEQNNVVHDSVVEDFVLKETDGKPLTEISSREYEIDDSPRENTKKAVTTKDGIKKDVITKEALKKETTSKEAVKKDMITKEIVKKDTDTKEIVKKDTVTKEILKKDTVTKEVLKKDTDAKEVLKKDTVAKDVLKKDTITKEVLKKDMVAKEILKKDTVAKEVLKKDTVAKEVLKKDMVTKEVVKKDMVTKELKDTVTKEVLKKDTVTKEVLKKDTIAKEIQKKDVVKELSVTKRDGLRESSRKSDYSKEMASRKDQKSREIMKKEITVKDGEVKELQVKELTVSPTIDKSENQIKETVKNDSTKDEVKSSTSREELEKCDISRKLTKEPLKTVVEKVSVKETEVCKKDYLKKDKEALMKDVEKDSIIKDVKKDEVSKDLNKKETLIVSKDANRKETQPEQDMKKSVPLKEVSKRDTPVTRKDLTFSKRELPTSKKDLSTKEVVKEIQSKREMLRRDSREDITTRKEVLKRGLAKEDKKEFAKDDLKKKPYIKEIPKSLRKTDGDKTETKITDIVKVDPVLKVEKNKRENETIKEGGKEIKKEKLCKESHVKINEEKSKEDQLLKEPRINSSNVKGKSVEDSNKILTSVEKKKEGKESKISDKQEVVPTRELMETLEVKQEKEEKTMKQEKRVLLRSETPSTEEDKTNDAEPPKTVGRKRLTVVNALDSVPNSPASTTDEEREYKSWKKSIMLLYGRLATHKYASLFLRPITDDQAPGYSGVVHRPIDLLTIKKNIETGVIRTTAEFQRDVMLMFLNSIMYNKSSHLVHKMAKQMQQEGMQHIQDYLTTQMLVQVVGDGVPIRRETRTTEANKQRDILGNPTQDETDSAQMHKRKRIIGIDSAERGFKKKKVDE